MTNLGVHFMDMGYWLTESDDAEVLSAGYHYINGYDVEDYATASIRMSSGCTLAIQTGYAYPMDETSKRDNHWNFAARQGYYTLSDGQMETRLFGRPTHIEQVCTDADLYYPLYVAATLGEYVADKPPSASLRDMLRARQMLDRIIEKAKR
jgi:predicted dehydrogenase